VWINTSWGVASPSAPSIFFPFMSTVIISSAVTKRRPDSSGPRALIRILSVPVIRALTWPLGSLVKLSLPRIRQDWATNSRNCDRSLINLHLRFLRKRIVSEHSKSERDHILAQVLRQTKSLVFLGRRLSARWRRGEAAVWITRLRHVGRGTRLLEQWIP